MGEPTHTGARNGHLYDDELVTLLGRRDVALDIRPHADYLAGATVLVTGAGGSIGAELAKRLTALGVAALVLVDHADAPLAALERALREEHGFVAGVPVLADIRNRARIFDVFERHRPDVVFHAAAHKHVSILESAPVEGVETNILGTNCVVDAARFAGAGRFVHFSTDKAVEPTNVLGRTKAVAEWIVSAAGREQPSRRYASVRLVNVVDSAGSLLPVFRRQVALGGPVTVTHPSATRFIMSAQEAAALAVVAGGLADSESVFWLDSGPPVPILDLARRLVSAAPGEVAIEFVGLRAGERLHERLFADGEEVTATSCEHVWRSPAQHVDQAWLNRWLAVLQSHVERASSSFVQKALVEMHAAPEPDSLRPTLVVA